MTSFQRLFAAIAALCIVIAGTGPAQAVVIGSFEDGLIDWGWELDDGGVPGNEPNSMTSVNVGSPIATDGDWALELDVSNKTDWYSAVKNFDGSLVFPNILTNSTIEFDVYVDDLPGGWGQTIGVINTEQGGWTQGPELNLNIGTNHYSWDYVAGGADVGGTWGGVHIAMNGGGSFGNVWIDNVQIKGAEPFLSSWEDSDDNWTLLEAFAMTPTLKQSLGGTAPDAAVTDGDYALKIETDGSGAWSQQIQLTGGQVLAEMKANDTVQFDFLLEAGTIFADPGWANIGLVLNHEGGFLQDSTTVTFDETDQVMHFEWKYGDDPNYDPTSDWVQFNLLSNADGTSPLGEFYVDNFYFSTATALPADFDEDGDVDGDDFLIWQSGFNNDDSGDADGDGDTDGDDFLIWQSSFGSGDGAGSVAVPEPSSVVIALVAALLAWFGRRRCH